MTATDTARTAPEPSVLALVLTYSAPRALVTCIRALVGQTRPPDAVVVVDNAGTPPAYDTLAAAGLAGGTVTVLRLEENTGPAGGHAEGLARFLASGHDFVWIMDDDCEPAVDCLRALLDDTHGTTTGQYLVPTWGDREGERIAHPAWWGPLLSRDVVERAGLPRAELFWWAEDTEYLLWRIPDLGYERRHCAGATVHHSRARGSARRPAWKYYYEARNSLYLRFRLRRRPWKAIRAVLRLCAAIVLWEDHKVSKLAALGRGVVDAVAGRLGRRMVPPPASTAPATGTVLHLLPVDLARGAQTYALALLDALRGDGRRHVAMTLFSTSAHDDRFEPLGVPDGALRRLGFDPRVLRRLRRVLRSLQPDVVVAHGGEPLRYVALVPRGRAALVYYKVGVSGASFDHAGHRLLYRWAARRADVVATVSQEVHDEVRARLGVPHDRLRLVPNGRDPAPFAGSPERRAGNGPVRLLWIGHCNPGKRPDLFLDVVARLRDGSRDVTAQMVGDGPTLDDVRRAARATGTEVLGRRDDVPELMAAADVVCFTSSGRGEGMPGVLIEAGLAARPIVTTAVPGASTVVDDGVSGFVVPVGDTDAFVAAVRDLVDDPERRIAMGKAARARCLEHYTLQASAQTWDVLLDELSSS